MTTQTTTVKNTSNIKSVPVMKLSHLRSASVANPTTGVVTKKAMSAKNARKIASKTMSDILAKSPLNYSNKNLQPMGQRPTSRIVKIADMRFIEEVQREMSAASASGIAAHFNYASTKHGIAMYDTVSGIYYVNDGMHVIAAAYSRGETEFRLDVTDIPVNFTDQQVIIACSEQFQTVNEQRAIASFYKYRAKLNIGLDRETMLIHGVTTEAGVEIVASGNRAATMTDIHNCRTACNMDRDHAVTALKFIKKHWGFEKAEGKMMVALTSMIKDFKVSMKANTNLDLGILYRAISDNGNFKNQKEIIDRLKSRMGEVGITEPGILKFFPKTAVMIYNEYVETNKLGEDKLLSNRVV